MPEEVHSPLLSLIKERSLIDELQYDEVAAEFKRSGKPVLQILQDFGIMDLDNILQVMADHLGTRVVSFREMDVSPQLIQSIPANTARMYECLPLSMDNGTLQVALVDPLNPARIDELTFLVKKDLQLVIADPAQIQKAIEKQHLSQQQAETAREAAAKYAGLGTKIMAGVAPVAAGILIPVWWGLLLWLIGTKAFKAQFPYMKAIEVAGLANMITVLEAIV